MKKCDKIISELNRTEEFFLVIMFAVMVGIIFVQVIMRYVFNHSLYWSEELGKFIFVWISWIGISIGERRNEHIKITMLVDKFPFRTAQVFNIISEIVVISICAITCYYATTLIVSQAGTHYAGIKISVAWGYLSVSLGCFLMCLRCIAWIVNSVRLIRQGKPDESKLEGSDS